MPFEMQRSLTVSDSTKLILMLFNQEVLQGQQHFAGKGGGAYFVVTATKVLETSVAARQVF